MFFYLDIQFQWKSHTIISLKASNCILHAITGKIPNNFTQKKKPGDALNISALPGLKTNK